MSSNESKSVEATYRLPRDPYLFLGKVLALIPEDWSWVVGELRAPDLFVKKSKVAIGVGYVLNHSARLVTKHERKDPTYEVLHEMITTPRLPQFVRFARAGQGGLTFTLAKRVATDYLKQGFYGNLIFFRGNNATQVLLAHVHDGPSHIHLALGESDARGQVSCLAPFDRLCRAHRLKEIRP